MKVYNIMCESYDEVYHDRLYSFVSGPYATKESAMKEMPSGGSSMGTSYTYYIKEVELK